MIVAVESNFVLELAFRRNEAADADKIVEFAARKRIHLIVPGCALFEPYETLVRRRKDRNQLVSRLKREIAQLARSEAFSDLPKSSESVARTLADSLEVEAVGLQSVIRRIIDVAVVLPLSEQVVKATLDVQRQFDLEPQDAVVFVSIDQFLREQAEGPKVFANRNARDFSKPDVARHFGRYDCKLLTKFADARQVIERFNS